MDCTHICILSLFVSLTPELVIPRIVTFRNMVYRGMDRENYCCQQERCADVNDVVIPTDDISECDNESDKEENNSDRW